MVSISYLQIVTSFLYFYIIACSQSTSVLALGPNSSKQLSKQWKRAQVTPAQVLRYLQRCPNAPEDWSNGKRYVFTFGWLMSDTDLNEYVQEITGDPSVGLVHEILVVGTVRNDQFFATFWTLVEDNRENMIYTFPLTEMPRRVSITYNGETNQPDSDITILGMCYHFSNLHSIFLYFVFSLLNRNMLTQT